MNVLILGHLVLDEIHTCDGTVIESFGGIHFPLSAFSYTANEADALYPVFPIGHDAWEPFNLQVGEMTNVHSGHCSRVEQPNTRVRLFHDAEMQYNTQLVTSLHSIPFEDFSDLLGSVNLVYINMMTGHDITIETAERLRAHTSALIYLDLHMIVYKVKSSGDRELSRADLWARWINIADVIQCNERELHAFIEPGLTEAGIINLMFESSALKHVVVTRGDRGATVFSPAGIRLEIPPALVTSSIDSTGCGDTFGSVFSYYLVRTGDIEHAGRYAALAAAFVLGVPGSNGMDGLGPYLQRIDS